MARRKTKKVEEVTEPVEETDTEPVETTKPVEEVTEPVETTKQVEETDTEPSKKSTEKKTSTAKTVKDILEEALKDPVTNSDASRYKRYIESTSTRHDEQVGVNQIYNIFLVLKSILEDKDYAKFKKRFDLFNKLMLVGRKEGSVFSVLGLSRYDYLWRWGKANYNLYYLTVTLIDELAHPGDRKNKLNKSPLSIDPVVKLLNQTGKDNLTKYYS